MINIFKIIRLPNLVIVGITLCILYFILLQPAYQESSIDLLITPKLFYLLTFTTILITLSGYLINDIEDRALDQINKPERHWIKSTRDLRKAKFWYGVLAVSGAIIAFYIAYQIEHLAWFTIYPVAVSLLYIYAIKLKSTVLWGNILVSFYCAGVAGLLLFAEMTSFSTLKSVSPDIHTKISHIFLAYMAYAFTTNLIREIIKDIEDFSGDQALNIHTLATKYGTRKAQNIAIGISILFILALSVWICTDHAIFDPFHIILSFFTIVLPSLYFLYLLISARTQKQITFLSKFAKLIMVLGLILLFLIR